MSKVDDARPTTVEPLTSAADEHAVGTRGGKPTEGGKFHSEIPRPLIQLDKTAILDRIAAGEYVPAIAESIGITKQALAQSLARFDKTAYLEAREIAAEIRLDEASIAIENARDVIDLARARERFKAVAWRAEREHPNRWAARPATQIAIGGNELTVNVVSYSQHAAPLPVDNLSTEDSDSSK